MFQETFLLKFSFDAFSLQTTLFGVDGFLHVIPMIITWKLRVKYCFILLFLQSQRSANVSTPILVQFRLLCHERGTAQEFEF